MEGKLTKRFSYYLKIWWMMSRNSFLIWLRNGKILSIVLTGKILRFIFFFLFLYFLIVGAGSLVGYNTNQIIFFFLTFNIVDVVCQFLFRQVYSFRTLIVNGDFDFILLKPVNVLFRSLLGGADVMDLLTIPPLILVTIYFANLLHPSLSQIILYIVLLLNAFVIATSFHIAVLAFGIITLEVDHIVMIYRDLTNLGKLPIDIYKQPLKGILTYLIPVGLMMTIPAKAMFGMVGMGAVALSFAVGLLVFYLSLKIWNFALKKYTSASS
jgi:ABC-2 type transport system permease protein